VLTDIGGKQFYLADFVGKGKQRQKRLVKAAAEQFYLFSGNKVADEKEKFGFFLLKPLKKRAGKVQRGGDAGIAVEQRNKGLKPGTVDFFKFIVFRAGGKMIMVAKYNTEFSGHINLILRYFSFTEKLFLKKEAA
jgi:hypothetical protein